MSRINVPKICDKLSYIKMLTNFTKYIRSTNLIKLILIIFLKYIIK